MNTKKKKSHLKTLALAFERAKRNKPQITFPDKAWKSREEYAIARGISKDKACRELKSMLTKGMLSIKRFYVKNITGTFSSVPHYRIKP